VYPREGIEWMKDREPLHTAIVCGSAPGADIEVGCALRHLPGCTVIVVNDAAAVVRGSHLMTQHPERASTYRGRSLAADIVVHAGKPRERATREGVDVYWPDALRNASSGGSALWLALQMGARQVVLCGLPLDGGSGYHPAIDVHRDEPRIGLSSPRSDYVRGYQEALKKFAATPLARAAVIRSTRGFTRELFGAPEWA
jgi:hypothetical protein